MIRQARPGEGRTLTTAYEWLLAAPGRRPPDWSTDIAARRLEEAIADDRSAVLVADESQTLVGFATVYLDIVSIRFGQRAWVEDLAVAPHRRSSGIGKALLDAAKAWARDRGAAWPSWSPDRRGSMPIASMSASDRRSGPGRTDGFCRAAQLNTAALLQIGGQLGCRVPIHQPERALDP